MEGGIGILLLLIIAVVALGLAIALYVTGGSIWARKETQDEKSSAQPEHKRPTSPAHEKTEFVGTRHDG
jgi:flagellar basal body-associated protein FliL